MKRFLVMSVFFIFAFPVMAKSWLGTKAPDEPKEVGDIVFNDGSAIPYTAELTLTDEQKAAAIAVIFYKGTGLNSGNDNKTSRTLGMGLKHNTKELSWCTYKDDIQHINISTIQCAASGKSGALIFTGDKNGSDNLEQISAFLSSEGSGVTDNTGSAENYPAFYFAKNYNLTATNLGENYQNGWYLPSLAELFQIYANGKGKSKVFDINAAITLCGGDHLENWYWSSSQTPASNKNARENTQASLLVFVHGDWDSIYKFFDSGFVCAIREF